MQQPQLVPSLSSRSLSSLSNLTQKLAQKYTAGQSAHFPKGECESHSWRDSERRELEEWKNPVKMLDWERVEMSDFKL